MKKLSDSMDEKLFLLHCRAFEGGVVQEQALACFKSAVESLKKDGWDVADYERIAKIYEEIASFQRGELILVETSKGTVKWDTLKTAGVA